MTFGYLPYADWKNPVNKFDVRKQDLYTKKVLEGAEKFMTVHSFMPSFPLYKTFPEEIAEIAAEVSTYDTQYTLQVEEIDTENQLYKMRMERNETFAKLLYTWIQANHPDQLIIPNGTIQEMGVAYRIAKWLEIPVTTYEFGEQRKRIWIAQNREVMRQETDDLWEARKDVPATDAELDKVHAM